MAKILGCGTFIILVIVELAKDKHNCDHVKSSLADQSEVCTFTEGWLLSFPRFSACPDSRHGSQTFEHSYRSLEVKYRH